MAIPSVSIILPTYNRAKFLPEAFAAIHAQQWTDWELIVVDDGSTDDTRDLVPELTRGWPQPVRYIHQENQGAYGARNTGLDHARGKYIAFYDSDDLWLPHHLSALFDALEANSEVDWAYAPCRIFNTIKQGVEEESTFFPHGTPREFLTFEVVQNGAFSIIVDSRLLEKMFVHGLYAGLQNSLIRRCAFDVARFDTTYANEAEDSLFLARYIMKGMRIGYLTNVSVIYRTHDAHSSGAGVQSYYKSTRTQRNLLNAFDAFAKELTLYPKARSLFIKNTAERYFWHLGYATHLKHGFYADAISAFWRGIRLNPWNLKYWKTLSFTILKMIKKSQRRSA